ncbi:MAG TPA: holo-ACP synthase, partial [Alphaproteobacteria bacterium]|nr:holo-ACP synthase [Alphaproteobacteria bacterium]
IGVVNLPGGKPTLKLTGGALVRLQSLVPDGLEPKIDVTLTDDRDLAHAFVLISTVQAE